MSAQLNVYQRRRPLHRLADEYLDDASPCHGFDVNGNPLQCRATTRKGTPCQRMPLPHNGYCPSHQHLDGDRGVATGARELELWSSGDRLAA